MGGSEKWGFVTLWKSGLDSMKAPKGADTASWGYWQARTMFAHLTPHRLVPEWANEGNAVITSSLHQFGIDDPDLRFIPDWRLDGAATVASTNAAAKPQDALVCFYLKEGRALMMVSSYAREDREVTVTVDPQKLFGRAGGLAFKDADLALKAPAARAASPKELKEAEEKMRSVDLLDTLDKKTAGFDVDVDNLEGKDPAVRKAERLALRLEGNSVKMVVRKQDFRLIEVRAGR